jgi:hypothetical protein
MCFLDIQAAVCPIRHINKSVMAQLAMLKWFRSRTSCANEIFDGYHSPVVQQSANQHQESPVHEDQ